MQAIIDDQGRIEIPQELPDRLHLSAGVSVNVEPIDDGLHITAAFQSPHPETDEKLVWDNGLSVFSRPGQVITVEDVNGAIESVQNERLSQIMSYQTED